MKLFSATFIFTQRGKPDAYHVFFIEGERPEVSVFLGTTLLTVILNHEHRLKPCVTHAKYAIDIAIGNEADTQHGRNKAEQIAEQKPFLKIAEEGEEHDQL